MGGHCVCIPSPLTQPPATARTHTRPRPAPRPRNGPPPQQKEVRETLYKASDRALYTNMHTENKLVAVDASSSKLVVILRADTFESGAHIDFYDE